MEKEINPKSFAQKVKESAAAKRSAERLKYFKEPKAIPDTNKIIKSMNSSRNKKLAAGAALGGLAAYGAKKMMNKEAGKLTVVRPTDLATIAKKGLSNKSKAALAAGALGAGAIATNRAMSKKASAVAVVKPTGLAVVGKKGLSRKAKVGLTAAGLAGGAALANKARMEKEAKERDETRGEVVWRSAKGGAKVLGGVGGALGGLAGASLGGGVKGTLGGAALGGAGGAISGAQYGALAGLFRGKRKVQDK